MAYPPDSKAIQAVQAGAFTGILVASGTGTTHGTANTASLVAHGALDKDGLPYPASKLKVLAIPSSNVGGVYRSAVPTATQIDIRSTAASVPYDWYLFVVN